MMNDHKLVSVNKETIRSGTKTKALEIRFFNKSDESETKREEEYYGKLSNSSESFI